MLHQRGGLPMLGIGALQPAGECDGERTNQERVLAVRFFSPAPARIAAQVGVGRAHHDSAPVVFLALIVVAGLVALQGGYLLEQLRIPHSAEAFFLGKGRSWQRQLSPAAPSARPAQRQPMQALHLAGKSQPQPGILRIARHQLDLLIERQPSQQIIDALVIGQPGVPEGVIRLRRGRTRQPRNQDQPYQCS